MSWGVLIRNLSEMLVTVQADPSCVRRDLLILQDAVSETWLTPVVVVSFLSVFSQSDGLCLAAEQPPLLNAVWC